MSLSDNPRNRIMGTLIQHAIFRWETLVTLIITAMLFLMVGDVSIAGAELPSWIWLVLGGVAEGALVFSALSDPEETEEALAREFESRYETSQIRNFESRDHLKSALEYRRNMLKLTERHKGAMRVSLRQTVLEVNEWIAHMYNIAEHIDSFEGNALVERDRQEVPRKISRVRNRIRKETDERLVADLEAQLKQLEQQKTNLEATKNSVERAKIQLESTLSSLGTMYAQMSLLGTKEVDSAKAQRLRLEIQDEVASLQDTIDAMDEVQLQSLNLG